MISPNVGSWRMVVRLLAIGLALSPVRLPAQLPDGRLDREVIVGELVGRTDPNEMQILTRSGVFRIAGQGNGKPFSVLRNSHQQVALQFHDYDLLPFNPNQLTIKFYETERALMSAIILEEVDFAILESEASAIDIRKSNNHYIPLPVPMEPNTVKMVAYNHRNPLLQTSKIRAALSYGIDHDYIVRKIISGGKASFAKGPFDDDSPLFNPGMKSYRYNPRLAQQILTQDGWADNNRDGILEKDGRPFVLQLFYEKGVKLDEAISRSIKISLTKLGIDIQPKPLSKAEINEQLEDGTFDAVLLEHTFENGAQSLREFFSVSGKKNYCYYTSRVFESYLNFYDESDDEKRKKTLIQSMQNVLNQDQPVTFIYFKWLTHYIINVERFANFRYMSGPQSGKFRPFEDWIIKPQTK